MPKALPEGLYPGRTVGGSRFAQRGGATARAGLLLLASDVTPPRGELREVKIGKVETNAVEEEGEELARLCVAV